MQHAPPAFPAIRSLIARPFVSRCPGRGRPGAWKLASSLAGAAAGLLLLAGSELRAESPPKPLDLGTRRELFVDHFLIEKMDGVDLRLHEPRLAPPMSEPADNLEYGTVIKDGDLFRLYTRDARGAKFDGDNTEVTRYCESRDGIHWTRPNLGLHEIDGSRNNNVILHEKSVCHNFSPFLDTRPGVPPEERFKALAGTILRNPGGGLIAFASGDGIHWRKLSDKPVLTKGAFDSQNVAFWSESEQKYIAYVRTFTAGVSTATEWRLDGLRSVSRSTSADFLHWSEPVPLNPNFPGEHLYTTLTHPYFRAPHISIALPTRFHPKRGSSTDILFMTVRGEGSFDRTFREAFIRPGLDPARWGNRSNYAALNVLPTGPNEMSIYTTPFRRFTLRTDGFASAHGGADPGELLTKAFTFEGTELSLNFSTSAGGSVKLEIQDAQGVPLPGYHLDEQQPMVGDAIDRVVAWKDNRDLAALTGKTIRLRFVLQEADVFALQFRAHH
jgi:hypothetical protein